jgi:hypothetical protein
MLVKTGLIRLGEKSPIRMNKIKVIVIIVGGKSGFCGFNRIDLLFELIIGFKQAINFLGIFWLDRLVGLAGENKEDKKNG